MKDQIECPICRRPLPEEGVCPICRPAARRKPTVRAEKTGLEQAAELLAAGQSREAIVLFLDIINAAPDDPKSAPVYEMLGDALREQNDVARALDAYRRAVLLKPTTSNRQKYDNMIDLSRVVEAKPIPVAPTPEPETGPELVIGGDQLPEAMRSPMTAMGQPIARAQQSPAAAQQPLVDMQKPLTSAQAQNIEAPLPLEETPLPVVNLPYTASSSSDGTPAQAEYYMSPAQYAALQARNRTFFLLGAAVVILIGSALWTAQPWHQKLKLTSYNTPISVVQIDVAPLPPALGSASGSGFSLLTQKPQTMGMPTKVKK